MKTTIFIQNHQQHLMKFSKLLQYLKIFFRAYNFIIKSITRILIIFKKPRKMTNDFFNRYIFVHTFQWTSSDCLTNVTVTVKVALIYSNLNHFLLVDQKSFVHRSQHYHPLFLLVEDNILCVLFYLHYFQTIKEKVYLLLENLD